MKKTAEEKEMYVLVDAHALIHRAYHAMPFLQNKQGVPSGALYGLTNMLLGAIEKFKPTHIYAGNDLPKTTFREMAHTAYKAHRTKTDDSLVEQIVLSPKVFEAFGIPLLSQEGYEADDVIGTLVKKIKEKHKKDKNFQVVILTGDMDIMQLVDGDNVVVYTGRKGEENLIFNEQEVFNKHGIKPSQISDYKGLRGDTSDNIPGIKGIGEKTATTIIEKGETLDKIYELIDEGKDKDFFGISERMFELLKNGREDAEFSKELATINCDIEVDIPEQDKYDLIKHIPELKNLCEEYSFLSIRRKLDSMLGLKQPIVLNDFAEVVESSAEVTLDGKKNEKQVKYTVSTEAATQIEFSSANLKKAQIALWLLNSTENSADVARLQYITGKNTEAEILKYLEEELEKNGLDKIYSEMELPLIPILDSSNKVGIKVDREKLQKLLKNYEKEKDVLVKEIYRLAGHEFNINSPKQLGVVLFEELKVQEAGGKMKKTASGKMSTRADVLEDMKDSHEIVSKILDYREKEKMINTYLEPLLMHSTYDERIHTTFVQTGAATGRFSSTNPNMQNIPVKGEEGTELRKCFIASPGKLLLAADYSQIELRVAAMLSGDEYLKGVYEKGEDIHSAVAQKMFNKKAEDITKDERNAAKAMNFGILYGMGVMSIKNTLKVERNVAQAFYDSYTQAMPGLMKYIKDTVSKAKDMGYTETLYGRRRQIPEIVSPIPMIRAAGERASMNAPIQGTNADIIKYAMVDFDNRCKELGYGLEKVAFLLQIHDEIIFEVDEKMVDVVGKELKEVMENVLESHKPKMDYVKIPLIANLKVGKNWGEM